MSTKQTFFPFPNLSKETRHKFKLNAIGLRPFGSDLRDLDIDFNESVLPTLITKLIRCCTVAQSDRLPQEDFFWNLPIGERIECLVKIAISDNHPKLVTILECKEEECKERFELSLSYNNIFSQGKTLQNRNDDNYAVTILGNEIQLRKPTALDQISWKKLEYTDQKDLLKNIVMDLIYVDSSHIKTNLASEEVIQMLGNEMSKIDPLVDYKIELECPYCRIKNLYEVNLQKISLRKMKNIQKELLYSIHQIALNYHWTEKEILAIPTARRNLYLSMIER